MTLGRGAAQIGIHLLEWSELHVSEPSTAPPERDSPSMVFDGEQTILYGGKSRGGEYKLYFNDAWVFNHSTNRWRPLGPGAIVRMHGEYHALSQVPGGRAPAQRSSPCLCLQDSSLVLAGGMSRARKLNDVHRLDFKKMQWREMLRPGMAPPLKRTPGPCSQRRCCSLLRRPRRVHRDKVQRGR